MGTWKQSKEKAYTLNTVQQAVWDSKKLKIHYEQADGEQKERLIEPLGLVAKGNKWYLVAARNGELRNYRVSRIQSAKVENETFIRPLNFNWRHTGNDQKKSLYKIYRNMMFK